MLPFYFAQNLQVNRIWKEVLVHLSVGPQWRHGHREQTYGPREQVWEKGEGQMRGERGAETYTLPQVK